MNLLGIGGAHIDRRGQITGDYMPAASNPGSMQEDIGGGALNALRNAAQLGVSCTMMSIRGGDAAGAAVAQAISDAGIIDLSATFLDRATPSYTAIIDRDGELITGFADMGLYDLAFPKQTRRAALRKAIENTAAVLCDANVPAVGLEKVAGLAAGKPVFAIGVSPAKVVRLIGIFDQLTCAFINRREAETLLKCAPQSSADLVSGLRALGLKAGVVTCGGEPLIAFDADGAFTLQPPAPRKILDVTGAGDALTGATIVALLHGRPLREAVREGVAASILAIESAKAVADLTAKEFRGVLALVPAPQAIE